jgi:predicted enzyme related to lactoylglutathione lyase
VKLSALRVSVNDIAAAKDFYGRILGLKELWDWGQAVGYDVGITLIIESHDPADPEQRELVGRFVGCSFAVENIDATYEELVGRGVKFIGPPEKMPWGGTLAHFEDPSRNVLSLVQL